MVPAGSALLDQVKTAYESAMTNLPEGAIPQLKDLKPYMSTSCCPYVIIACARTLGIELGIRSTKKGMRLMEERIPAHVEEMYEFIKRRFNETGICLSMREIQNEMGMSLSTIRNDLLYLAVTGKIEFYNHGCRTIRPIVEK